MERITFLLTKQEKKELKIKAINENKSLTKYIKDLLNITTQTPQKTATERINEINETLQKNGANITTEQRQALKSEREQLRKEL